jgi:DnaK suppressor protein
MANVNLKRVEAALRARARELGRSVAERSHIAVQRSSDEFDNALLATERESYARTLERDMQLLHQVEAALVRLRKGAYGICLSCDEAIAPQRLAAIPWAACCLACQTRAEERGVLLAASA